ncbi:MAG: diguanylate cyclase [Ectothiorhodospiraceae bacterium]|nr:diguanylate cyclase [Ectothiorhodospiraceae bacterium]MCH8503018.1 diguanylate cyclase [Ectothiorhodospiraceae bacterium]
MLGTRFIESEHEDHVYLCNRSGVCVRATPVGALQGQLLTAPDGEIWRSNGLPSALGVRLGECLEAVVESRGIARFMIQDDSPSPSTVTYACQVMPASVEGQLDGVSIRLHPLTAPSDQIQTGDMLRRLMDTLPTAALMLRLADWKCVYGNEAAAMLLGCEASDLIGEELSARFERASDPASMIEALFQKGHLDGFESALIDNDRQEVPVTIFGSHAFANGHQTALLLLTRREPGYGQLAMTGRDALTGLLDRNQILDRLQQATRRATARGKIVATLFVDLDRFKEVNDSYGHGVGDELLAVMATRLTRCVRHYESVGRIGGDEFVVVLENLDDVGEATRVAEEIERTLSQPARLGSLCLLIGGSVGISYFPFDGKTGEQLIQSADQAMYLGKRGGSQASS